MYSLLGSRQWKLGVSYFQTNQTIKSKKVSLFPTAQVCEQTRAAIRQATAEPEESVAKEATVNETDEDAVNETQEEKTEEAFNEKIGSSCWCCDLGPGAKEIKRNKISDVTLVWDDGK